MPPLTQTPPVGRNPGPKWPRVIALLCLWCGGISVSAQTEQSREYEIKAVFLFNFSQFVEWPPAAFAGADAPLVIGVLGQDPFGAQLDETVRDEKVGHRSILIRRFRKVEEIDICHILFISSSETGRLDQIMEQLGERSVLTVSDGEGFALRGVMIRFVTERKKIRLRINLLAAQSAGLTLSSKLLRPAEIVTMEGP